MIRIYGKFVERFVSIYMSAKAKWPLKAATCGCGSSPGTGQGTGTGTGIGISLKSGSYVNDGQAKRISQISLILTDS